MNSIGHSSGALGLPNAPHGALPFVTVAIPARNEESAIRACIDSVLAQDYPNLEVLVIDGASGDKTAEIVGQYSETDPRVILISNPDRIIPKAMNLALAAARGVYLVRVDAHSTIPRTYVSTAVGHLDTGRWGGVGGRKDGVGTTDAGRAIALVMASPFGVGGSTYHYGEEARTVEHVPFGAYVVAKARALGGWDERLLVNQDFEFDHRMGLAGEQLLFDPELSINWECRQSVGDFWRQYSRYGQGTAKVLALHPASASPRHIAVPGYVAALVLAGVLTPLTVWPLAVLAFPYLAFVAVGTFKISSRTNDWRVRRWIAPSLVAMHIGWGVGFLRGIPEAVSTLLQRRKDVPVGAQEVIEDRPRLVVRDLT